MCWDFDFFTYVRDTPNLDQYVCVKVKGYTTRGQVGKKIKIALFCVAHNKPVPVQRKLLHTTKKCNTLLTVAPYQPTRKGKHSMSPLLNSTRNTPSGNLGFLLLGIALGLIILFGV
jgi:hypothetical protein